MDYTTGGIADAFVEQFDLVCGRTQVFKKTSPSFWRFDVVLRQQLEVFDVGIPPAFVDHRVFDPHVQFKRVVAGAVITLLQVHFLAVGIAKMIDP